MEDSAGRVGLGEICELPKYYMRFPGKVTKSFELTEKMQKAN